MNYKYPKQLHCECGDLKRKGSRPALLALFFSVLFLFFSVLMMSLLAVNAALMCVVASVYSLTRAPRKQLYVCPTCRRKQVIRKPA